MTRSVTALAAILVCAGPANAQLSKLDGYLAAGQLALGEMEFSEALRERPEDDATRFALGTLKAIRAVEGLGQGISRLGVRTEQARQIPFLRLPVPDNADSAKVVKAEDVRAVFGDFQERLADAEATLAPIDDDGVSLEVRIGTARLDLDGDGKADEPFRDVLARFVPDLESRFRDNADLHVRFDRADVAWLRGYCHLLMGLCDVVLAHDMHELFDATAHVLFQKAESPYPFLTKSSRESFLAGDVDLTDLIAAVHLMRFPVREPERLRAALDHFDAMLRLSRAMWTFALAETDDEREWIPNPSQTGVLRVPINREQVDAWLAFVDEGRALLAGEKLVPFWRGDDGRGINLRRVFTEPTTFDLVLWVQGTAAAPYLEEGPLTTPDVWERLLRVFGGEFAGFALWIN